MALSGAFPVRRAVSGNAQIVRRTRFIIKFQIVRCAKIINSAWNDRKIGIRKLSLAVTPGPLGPFPVRRSPTVPCHADLNNDSSSRAINDYCCKLPSHSPRLSVAPPPLGLRIILADRSGRLSSFSCWTTRPVWSTLENTLDGESDQLCALVRRPWSHARRSRLVTFASDISLASYPRSCESARRSRSASAKKALSFWSRSVISFLMRNTLNNVSQDSESVTCRAAIRELYR